MLVKISFLFFPIDMQKEPSWSAYTDDFQRLEINWVQSSLGVSLSTLEAGEMPLLFSCPLYTGPSV